MKKGQGFRLDDRPGSANNPQSFQSTYNANDCSPEEPDTPEDNNICVEYHPKSGLKAAHFPFYKFSPEKAAGIDTTPDTAAGNNSPAVDQRPWRPFSSRLDFELADLILESHMNSQQTDWLLSLIQKCIEYPKEFTLRDNKEIKATWEAARKIHTNEVRTNLGVIKY